MSRRTGTRLPRLPPHNLRINDIDGETGELAQPQPQALEGCTRSGRELDNQVEV